MTKAIWLVIEIVQDIMPNHILTKFGDDGTKASQVKLTTYYIMPIHILTKFGDNGTKASKVN